MKTAVTGFLITFQSSSRESSKLAGEQYAIGLNGDFHDNVLNLRKADLSFDAFKASVSAKADFSDLMNVLGTGQLDFGDTGKYPFTFGLRNGAYAEFQSDQGIYISASLDSKGLGGTISLDRLSSAMFALPDLQSSISANGTYKFSSLEDWYVSFSTLDLGYMKINPLNTDKRMRVWANSMVLNASGGIIQQLNVQDAFSLLRGDAKFSWDLFNSFQIQGELNLKQSNSLISNIQATSNNKNTETYTGSFKIASDKIEGKLNILASPLQRFAPQGLSGAINSTLTLGGTFEAPVISGKLSIDRGLYNKANFTLSSNVSFYDKGLNIRGLKLNYADTYSFTADSLYFNTFERLLKGQGNFKQDSEKKLSAIDWNFVVQWAQGGFWDQLKGTLSIKHLPEWISPDGNWILDLQGNEDLLTLIESSQKSLYLQAKSNGNFELTMAKPFPLAFNADGNFNWTKIEANIHNIKADASLSRFFPFADSFVMTEGQLSGDLRLVGDINDAGIYGYVRGSDIYCVVPYVDKKIYVPKAGMVFDGYQWRLLPLIGQAGDSKAKAELDLEISRYGVKSAKLKIATLDNPVSVRGTFPGIQGKGKALGSLDFTFLPQKMLMNGNLVFSDTELTLSTQSQGEAAPETIDVQPYGTEINLDFQTAKGVVFYWPSRDVPLLSTYIDQGQKINLQYDQLQNHFSLKGNVKTRGGTVNWYKKDFFIRDGVIDFDENQSGFDPFVTVRAEWRTILEDSPYKVYLVVDKNRLSQLQPRFESSPYLSQTQIHSLVFGDLVAEEDNQAQDILGDLVETTSQIFLFNPLETSMRNFLNVDVFHLRAGGAIKTLTTDFTNILSPSSTDDVSIGKYFDDTSLIIGKYIGEDLYIEGVGLLQSRDRSYGPGTNFLNSVGLDLSTDLNLEFNTPYFTLLWTFSPDLLEPKNLFVLNNTFSFTFRL